MTRYSRIKLILGMFIATALIGALSFTAGPTSAGAPEALLHQGQPTPTPTLEAPEPLLPAPSPIADSTLTAKSLSQPAITSVEWGQPLVSDGQFVWGPNVGDFDITEFLAARASPLLPYSNLIEVNAAYAGLNPRVLLTVLEIRYGFVSDLPETLDAESLAALIEETSMALHLAFYEHLYQWGSRADQTANQAQPSIALADGASLQVASGTSSGSYALASILGNELPSTQAEPLLSAETQGGFGSIFASFFPDVDPLDTSNDINPPGLPPDDLFQLPFPLDSIWHFSGLHSWAGGNLGSDRSSIDFLTSWPDFPDFPYKNTVAAAQGSARIRTPYSGRLPCWVEVDHGDGWMTSYYHLRNIGSTSGPIGLLSRNQLIGAIGTETCNGGFATGAHVHFTLWYNGALFDLDGVKLSGWTLHEGPRDADPYTSGYIERDGVTLTPYSTVTNDYNDYYGTGFDFSLRFFGNGSGDVNRLSIPVTDLDTERTSGPPVDIGYFDFSFEWWMKADPGANTTPEITCGANDNWKDGNILFDRSRSSGTNEWGVSITDGRIAFGVSGATGQKYTLCSTASVDDGSWHHILIQRNRHDSSQGYLDGQLWLFVDGVLQGTEVGPGDDISYPDGVAIPSTCGASGTQYCSDDPNLLVGASKYDMGLAFDGWIDDLRISGWIRYLVDFTMPIQPLTKDSLTLGLFSFNEGSSDVIYDTGGYDSGTSNGWVRFGGSPAGPVWTTMVPHVEYQHHYLPIILQ